MAFKLLDEDDCSKTDLELGDGERKSDPANLSVSSGEPTIAESDSDEDYTPPVWIPLKEEIDHNIAEIDEKSKSHQFTLQLRS